MASDASGPSAPRRYALLDTLKGVACLAVLLHHSTFYVTGSGAGLGGRLIAFAKAGSVGVPIFFVISGYCIATSADGRRRRSGAATDFFSRRFRRIYPPLWTFLGLLAAVLLALGAAGRAGLFADAVHPISRPEDLGPWQWLGNLSLIESWRATLLGGPSRQFLAGHLWTLCYEEQFYAICGLLLVVAPRRWFAGATAVTAAVALILIGRKAWPNLPVEGLFYDGRWLLFAAGILAYGVLMYRGRGTRLAASMAMAALAVILGVPALAGAEVSGFRLSLGVGAAVTAALLGIAPWEARLAAMPAMRPLNWLGLRCYSFYLVHFPIAKLTSHAASEIGLAGPWATLLLTIPCVAALSVAVAATFYRAVERRFLRPGLDFAEGTRSRQRGRGLLMPKRLFDILAAGAGLIVLLPLLGIVAVAVKWGSPGPILFRHRRVGRGGREFTLLKFRTMTVRDGSERGSFDAGDRSRVTRVGRVLRAAKLDELPQLWNVLVGDMSLVGPRPEVRAWVDLDPEGWAEALSVTPGITDPASILFRDEEAILAASPDPDRLYREQILPRKLALYRQYARSRTFRGDLAILWRTARALASRKAAPSEPAALIP